MQVPTPQDDAMLLTDTTTKTASFDTNAYDNGGNFSPGGIGMPAAIVADVSALDLTSGNETYALKMQESSDNSTWSDCGASVSVTGVGIVIVKGFLTKEYTRLDGALGGTTPSITVKAWLNTSLQR